jgi:hypothetical protein
MSLVVQILLLLLLGLTFFQDWKFRAVHWILFPLIALDACLIFFMQQGDWKVTGLNLTFVFIVISVLFIYVSVREQKWTNIFKAHFGIGDVLFLIAIIPLFGNTNYILFFISGMVISMLLHFGISLIKKSETIPLAGYLAVYLIGLKLISFLTDQDLFYTTLWN